MPKSSSSPRIWLAYAVHHHRINNKSNERVCTVPRGGVPGSTLPLAVANSLPHDEAGKQGSNAISATHGIVNGTALKGSAHHFFAHLACLGSHNSSSDQPPPR